jgi:hypothetical protein
MKRSTSTLNRPSFAKTMAGRPRTVTFYDLFKKQWNRLVAKAEPLTERSACEHLRRRASKLAERELRKMERTAAL